jgi:hypothetical protein
MLGLFGKKSDHPMADLKAAQQLLADLPKEDSVKILHELAGWIESVRTDTDIRLDNRFAVLRLLDETARPHEIKVAHEYFSADAVSPVQERRLWKELSEFYAALGEAYHGVLAGCHDGDKGASALKMLRQLIVVRGINAVAGRLKCAAAHYVPVAPELWSQLSEYYAEAEVQDFLDDDIELYPGGGEVSVGHQLAGVLLWWASGTGTLKPRQMHLSERLAAHVCGSLSMGGEPAEDTLFVLDLSQSTPPARYNGDTAAHPNLRFVGLGGAQEQIEGLIAKLEQGTIPADLDLGGRYDAESVLEMARRLSASLLAAPPARRNVRRSISVNLAVLKGMSEVMAVAGGAAAEPGPGKSWVAEDISATGFRCNLDFAQGAGIMVGSLVGFRPENVQHWGIGVVRRLRRGEQNKLDVGVEILANRMTGVALREEGGAQGAAEMLGIWLGAADPAAPESRVLVKPGAVAEGRLLRMRAGSKSYMLMPQGVAERGDEFDLMRFQAVERSPD